MPIPVNKPKNAWEGVGAGQTATARIGVGMRIHNLMIPYSGVTLAEITEIRVIANGQTIQRLIGADVVDKVNQFDAKNAANGIITINFERTGLISRAGREITAIDTTTHPKIKVPITTLSLEVDIAGTATNPVLGAPNAKELPMAKEPSELLVFKRVFGYDPQGSGEFQIADLPKTGAINRIIIKSSATINNIKVDRNNYTAFDRTKAMNELIQNDGVRVPQAGYYVIDFTEEGYGQDWLEVQGATDFRLKLDMAGAGHLDVIVEYLDTLKG